MPGFRACTTLSTTLTSSHPFPSSSKSPNSSAALLSIGAGLCGDVEAVLGGLERPSLVGPQFTRGDVEAEDVDRRARKERVRDRLESECGRELVF